MKTLVATCAVMFLVGVMGFGEGKALGQDYLAPTVVQTYYPAAPVYAYPAPVVPGSVMMPAPVVVARPVVVGPLGKVYVPGRPIRNAVRAVLP